MTEIRLSVENHCKACLSSACMCVWRGRCLLSTAADAQQQVRWLTRGYCHFALASSVRDLNLAKNSTTCVACAHVVRQLLSCDHHDCSGSLRDLAWNTEDRATAVRPSSAAVLFCAPVVCCRLAALLCFFFVFRCFVLQNIGGSRVLGCSASWLQTAHSQACATTPVGQLL